MTSRKGPRTRDEGRHWLPTQGVDPAPLAELNSECLGLLAIRAADGAGALPLLLAALRPEWAALPAQAVRRLAAAPYSFFDVGFSQAPRWLEIRSRGVHERLQCNEPAFFEPDAARSIARRMLVYGWHLARSRPRAASLVFGVTVAVVESLAACPLTVLESAAEHGASALRPRWATQPLFWREMLAAATAGDDGRLHELLLGGIQRLAAETFATPAP